MPSPKKGTQQTTSELLKRGYIPIEPFRSILRRAAKENGYDLDTNRSVKARRAQDEKRTGRYDDTRKPIHMLAERAGLKPDTVVKLLSRDSRRSVSFDVADKLFCAVGLGALGWIQNKTIKSYYRRVTLRG